MGAGKTRELSTSRGRIATTHGAISGPRVEEHAPPSRSLIGDKAAFLLALVLGATFGIHRLIDPDVFLQVAVGRAILSQLNSLGVSTFVDAYPNYHYVEDKWLASVAVALADAAGGPGGLMIYQVALCVLATASWYYMQRAWRASPAASLAGVSLALLICNFRLEPRPDTMSHALLALTLGLTVANLSSRRLLWLTPMLFAVWANLHGYFVNGLLVLLGAAWSSPRRTDPTQLFPNGSEGSASSILPSTSE